MQDAAEKSLGPGVGLLLRGFVGFQETFDQMLRGRGLIIRERRSIRDRKRLLAGALNEFARCFKYPSRFFGSGAQFTSDFKAAI